MKRLVFLSKKMCPEIVKKLLGETNQNKSFVDSKHLAISTIFLNLLELYHQHLQPCKEYTQSKWFGCEDIVTPSALHFSVDVTWCCLFIEPLRNNQHSVYVLTFILLKSRKENQIKDMEFLC